jgi:hypothetical protein
MRRITRTQAIQELREVLLRMVDQENSLCRVAAWRKLFCHGFSQWSREELERRFPAAARPGLERGHLELQANRAQLGRQDVLAGRLPCDIPAGERGGAPCAGWSGFDDRDLARFHREICGESVRVVPDGAPSPEERAHGRKPR